MNRQARPAEEPERRRYHHGDVPAAAVDAALRHLRRERAPSFTLRSIARDLGVSHPSLYNHFAGRDALIDAVAVLGFRDLAGRLEEVIEAGADDLATVRATGRAVIDFAREEPALYRLMFGADLMGRKAADARLSTAMEAPLRLVAQLVAKGHAGGLWRPGDPLLIAAGMWAAAHGLALLIIDGRLAVLGADRADALIASTLDAVLRGYAAPLAAGGCGVDAG